MANNKTLAIAKAHVEAARAARGVARSSLLPEIDGTAGASRGNQGYATNNQAVTITGANVEASWELDLFGRNQARLAESTAILESEEATQKAVRVACSPKSHAIISICATTNGRSR